ncbi:MAG: hypothetical protein IH840_05635 [Candidatus Heimdallarchaeota archaeon]|nr:hypothetical protein [Candidatus Heimdallarchaeota archaeon]
MTSGRESSNLQAWQQALLNFMKLTSETLVFSEINWFIIGSVATALQGCSLIPNDIDIVVSRKNDVGLIASCFSHLEPKASPVPVGDPEWISSQELSVHYGEPDSYGFQSVFARWKLDGFKIEVAHITPPTELANDPPEDGEGIWEANFVNWKYANLVDFRGYKIPLSPLEIQLQTNMDRGLEHRVNEILRIFRREGYTELLETALSKVNHKKFLEMMEH